MSEPNGMHSVPFPSALTDRQSCSYQYDHDYQRADLVTFQLSLISSALCNFAAGSDVVGMKCRADRVDGGYMLNGNKMWCTNGPTAQTLVCTIFH